MTINLVQSKVAHTVAAIRAQDALIEAATAERKRLSEYLVSLHPAGTTGTFTCEAGSYNIAENNSYDQDAMRAALKPGQVARCEVRKMDSNLVKTLYPAIHAAAKNTRGYKVTMR